MEAFREAVADGPRVAPELARLAEEWEGTGEGDRAAKELAEVKEVIYQDPLGSPPLAPEPRANKETGAGALAPTPAPCF